ncbi:MAG: hypothetical protein ACMX3H_14975 [Sodalis sp. (in: enterobacteria)]|uniref:hypothetical protein n=1 Tax=Sodalis sp. (in: enterobacteria) TaxID=1898979 RepID=UPI0039E26E50
MKGDNRKHLGFHNQDGSVRMWLYKDKGGDGVRLNNGNDGGGDWVFNKNGHLYSPQALHAAGATYQEDGNIHGSVWGGHLSGWLHRAFIKYVRLSNAQVISAQGYDMQLPVGGVVTGFRTGGQWDMSAGDDFVYCRLIQVNVNGQWATIGQE